MIDIVGQISLVEWIALLWIVLLGGPALVWGLHIERERAKSTVLQSIRWVLVGVFLAISTDAYRASESFIVKIVILLTAIIMLFVTEYHIRALEPDSN